MGDSETIAIIDRKDAPTEDPLPAPLPAPIERLAPSRSSAALPPMRRPSDPLRLNPEELDFEAFLALDRTARLRLFGDLTTRPPSRRYSGPTNRLDQAFRSILGAAQIVSFARRAQIAELVAAIAEGLEIEPGLVRRAMDDRSGEAFVVLLKVIGLDNIQAQQVLLLATPTIGRDVTAFFKLADIFAALESFVAESLVAAWRGTTRSRPSATIRSLRRTPRVGGAPSPARSGARATCRRRRPSATEPAELHRGEIEKRSAGAILDTDHPDIRVEALFLFEPFRDLARRRGQHQELEQPVVRHAGFESGLRRRPEEIRTAVEAVDHDEDRAGLFRPAPGDRRPGAQGIAPADIGADPQGGGDAHQRSGGSAPIFIRRAITRSVGLPVSGKPLSSSKRRMALAVSSPGCPSTLTGP